MTQPLSRRSRGLIQGLAAHEELALCLDIDGTLAPIVADPAAARVPLDCRALLRRLHRRERVTLILVSGRELADARRVVGITADWTIGNHGFEYARRGGKPIPAGPAGLGGRMRKAAQALERATSDLEGVTVEDKGWTIAIHFRRATRSVRSLLWERARRATQGMEVARYRGRCIIDVRPAVRWDKGTALVALLRRVYGIRWVREVGLVYAGDDVTDEHAFRALPKRAMTVKVGRGPTSARYRTRSPSSLAGWLMQLDRALA